MPRNRAKQCPMLEPNKLVQDEELEALRAIFEEEWTDVPAKITAWGTEEQGGWWEVKLKGEDERVSVTLRGRMTKTYPDQPPPLTLVDPIMLSPFQVQTLHKLLADKAKASVGAPMIFDLADFVRDWITHNHLPLTTPGVVVPTLMEEMALREEAQRAAERAEADAAMQKLRAQAEQQNELLNEKIQLDASRKEQRAKQVMQSEAEQRRLETIAGLGVGEMELRELVFDSQISVDGYEGSWEMWMLFGGRREGLWTTYLAEPVVPAVAVSFARASLPLLWLQVVDFASPFYSTSQGIRRIELLVVEIQKAIAVRHRNLATVYAVKRERSPQGWERIVILVEKAEDGGRLRGYLMRGGLGEEVARDYIQQLLSGIEALHKRLITHREISPDHILLTRDVVTGEMVLKLADCAYARKITELNRSNPFLKSVEDTSIPESWLSQDELDAPYSFTPKRDMWHAGLVFAQMLWGYDILRQYPDLATLSTAPLAHLPDAMGDVLRGMLASNPKKRLCAEEALDRLQVPEETTRRAVPISYSGNSAPTESPTLPLGRSPVFGKGLASYWSASAPQAPGAVVASRYKTDFEEVEFLGKGGFGEVVKAKNKLDGRFYAIKKVKLRPEDNEQKVYREVNSLSRVSHQYIVRYFGCWLETTNRAISVELDELASTSDAPVSTDDDSLDIFRADFDDFSTRRSQSASFPRIRFANSSGSDSESDADSDSSDVTESRSSPKPRGRPVSMQKPSMTNSTDMSLDDSPIQRTLFIQMEFVEKQTLREVITHGLDEDEGWQYLLQILQALAHMSSLGIVHRDLKPSNILIDASGNVKIADFGLSTTEITAVEAPTGVHQAVDLSDLTSGIGTSLYIAPEVSISRSYNEKADMYSLGIIFFEMCFAFATSMERAQVLGALRLPTVVFPSGWPATSKPNQRELIAWLLRHDPVTRPTATQVLQSSLLPPPEKEKEYYTAAITEITNPRSAHYPDLLDSLFAVQPVASARQADDKLLDFTYDNENDEELQVWLSVVVQRLVDLFQRHGAVDDFVPLLLRETNLLAAFPDLSPVRLLDRAGQVVQLPCSGLLAMARSAARRQIERIKRYSTGRGRYSEHPAGGQPKVIGELSFDICSPLRSQVAEAELLEIVDKVVLEFRGLRGLTGLEYEFHLSHEIVLDIVLSGVPHRARGQVLKAFKSIGSGVGFNQSRSHLSSVMHLPKHVLDDLEHCCICDEVEVVQARLESIFPSSRRKLTSAFAEIRETVQLARAFGVNRRILFRPTLARNAEFFKGGLMFECVRKGKQRDVIAFGGRYDHLLEHFKEPPKTRQYTMGKVYGVGMTVAVDHLARLVRKYESGLATRLMSKENEEERSFGFWSPSRCDVYVASSPQVRLDQRLGVVGELWRAGIRADLQYDDDRSLEDVFLECMEQNILYLIIPRANRPTVKVRSVLKRNEEEVPRTEICGWLRVAIADQRRVDAAYASAEGSIPSSQATALGIEAPQHDADIRLILPPEPASRSRKVQREGPNRKHRHVTKGVFYEKAYEFITSVKSPLPLFALDAPYSLLAQLCMDTNWMNDDESWRSVIAAAGFDRQYGEMIKESLRDWGVKSGPFVWLFSVREVKGCLLQYHR